MEKGVARHRRGFFITFEGPEGSGKSTQAKLLCRFLKKRGLRVAYLREPGGTELGERIRRLLLKEGTLQITDEAEALLYLAARAELVKRVIEPLLKRGELVICDRFQDSTIAYQGYGGGVSLFLIERIGRVLMGDISPDLTILLDIAPRLGLSRAKRKDRMERKPVSYHERVRKGYLALAEAHPMRIKVVSVEGAPATSASAGRRRRFVADGIQKAQEKIRKEVERVLSLRGR